jgi:hypothetical protein
MKSLHTRRKEEERERERSRGREEIGKTRGERKRVSSKWRQSLSHPVRIRQEGGDEKKNQQEEGEETQQRMKPRTSEEGRKGRRERSRETAAAAQDQCAKCRAKKLDNIAASIKQLLARRGAAHQSGRR